MSFISVFDVMGPNMIGPSSSHTAGAARIAFLAISIGMNDYKLNQLAAQRVAVSPAGSADEYLDEEEEEFFS